MSPYEYIWKTTYPSIVLLAWRDTKVVSFLSTFHNPYVNNLYVTRKKKGKKRKRNGQMIRDPFQLNQVLVPTIVKSYCQNMRAVDTHDQHISYYPTQRKSFSWFIKH